MLNQEFDTKVSTADFVCPFWTEENCNPENWAYKPSTYDVKGATLVGPPGMKLWSETTGGRDHINYGRAEWEPSLADELDEEICTKGVNSQIGSFVYWDVDLDETVNGDNRRELSDRRGIPGWMHQGIRFDSPVARIRFAAKSNAAITEVRNISSSKDVEKAVTTVMELLEQDGIPVTKDSISTEVRDLGFHLAESTRDSIRDRVYMHFVRKAAESNDPKKLIERYVGHNNGTMSKFLETNELTETWVTRYWVNDDEVCLMLNVNHFEARIGAILSANRLAVEQDKPLHIIFCVAIPEGKETLTSKREKVFSTHFQSLEDRILKATGLSEMHRRLFAWNHTNCQHRAVPQDSHNEDLQSLIKGPFNRKFN
tara:strand:+ start:161 stop:1270 length:1110 start_codon:yes stop_codon:yes gene_type:complete